MISNVLERKDDVEFYGCHKTKTILNQTQLSTGHFSIEEYWGIVDTLESTVDIDYIRMDFGIPGIKPFNACVQAHLSTISNQSILQNYPPACGVLDLRREASQFINNQLNVNGAPENIFVTCGGTQALFVALSIASKLKKGAKKLVVLAPNYPPVNGQAKFLGLTVEPIEIDSDSTESMFTIMEELFKKGDVAAVYWASPNNPTWSVLSQNELSKIAELCKHYEVIPIEDLTYLGMVTSDNPSSSVGFPSIASYSDKFFSILSTSKLLSYAGERIGFLYAADELLVVNSSELAQYFGVENVQRAIGNFIFNQTAGAPHSSQYAVAKTLNLINEGVIDLNDNLSIYVNYAKRLKQSLLDNGFSLLYEDNSNTDGFYVCFSRPGLSAIALITDLLYYGISVLPIKSFGSSSEDGVRACVGRLTADKLVKLEVRLQHFNETYKSGKLKN